ncbi:vomeronasal type-1 receptor 4-like [Nannospalax galili]|uniref:vomeronasal type-1 receptor 4-like n=1 Tax=Nannospalax galili TaxID=1026970 RepID=UPI00111C2FBD|nr:vomeronasal type-1 receptor 4-like [Nannospalax galili]
MAAFGLKQFFGDFVCKLIFYVYRQGRSMSISTTCLLSVFQAITISARKSYWKILKTKATKYLGLSISTYWILYMTVNFIFPVYVYAKWKGRNITMRKTDFDYCATIGCDEVTGSLYAALFMFPEVLLSVLMVWSSGSMIVSLYRHKQNVQYIHSTGVSWRTSAENRATQSILVTASTFITFYILFAVFQAAVWAQSPAVATDCLQGHSGFWNNKLKMKVVVSVSVLADPSTQFLMSNELRGIPPTCLQPSKAAV